MGEKGRKRKLKSLILASVFRGAEQRAPPRRLKPPLVGSTTAAGAQPPKAGVALAAATLAAAGLASLEASLKENPRARRRVKCLKNKKLDKNFCFVLRLNVTRL